MRITKSAYRRGLTDADIQHAIRLYLWVYSDDEIAMFIGPARDGTLLEIGVIDDEEDPRIIHAMTARRRFLR